MPQPSRQDREGDSDKDNDNDSGNYNSDEWRQRKRNTTTAATDDTTATFAKGGWGRRHSQARWTGGGRAGRLMAALSAAARTALRMFSFMHSLVLY
jgi:hypothetical protein